MSLNTIKSIKSNGLLKFLYFIFFLVQKKRTQMIKQFVIIRMSFSRIKKIRDDQLEVPGTFLNELHRWSLECKYNLSRHFQY